MKTSTVKKALVIMMSIMMMVNMMPNIAFAIASDEGSQDVLVQEEQLDADEETEEP